MYFWGVWVYIRILKILKILLNVWVYSRDYIPIHHCTKMIHKNNWKYYVFMVFYGATSFRTWRYRLARTGCLLKIVSHCMRRVTKAWHHQHRWTVGSLQACSFIVICNKIRLLCSVSNSYCENRCCMKTITRSRNENSSLQALHSTFECCSNDK